MKRIIIIIALLALFATNAQAQIIGATNNAPQKPEQTTRIENNALSKHYLRFEWEYYNGFRAAYGYQINRRFSVGAGIGSYIPKVKKYNGDTFIDYGFYVFSDITYSIPVNEWSIFFKLRFDQRLHSYYYSRFRPILHITLQPGVSYKNFSLGIGRYGWGLSEDYGWPIYEYLGINFIYSLQLKKH